MLTIIVAVDRNGAIGMGGTIPWNAPEDLRSFQKETLGGAVIMGRRTWSSLPHRPLKGRLNCVVSTDETCADLVFTSFTSALKHAYDRGYSRTYAIGGAGIYKEALRSAERIMITRVDLAIEAADTWFPEFHEGDWKLLRRMVLRTEQPFCEAYEYLRR